MDGRDIKIQEEAAALWRQLHGDAPPEGADGAALLDLIMGGLPAPQYERLSNPYLRPSNIAFPKRADA